MLRQLRRLRRRRWPPPWRGFVLCVMLGRFSRDRPISVFPSYLVAFTSWLGVALGSLARVDDSLPDRRRLGLAAPADPGGGDADVSCWRAVCLACRLALAAVHLPLGDRWRASPRSRDYRPRSTYLNVPFFSAGRPFTSLLAGAGLSPESLVARQDGSGRQRPAARTGLSVGRGWWYTD